MSRLTLQWFNLTQRPGQDVCLKIPLCEVYSGIIDRAFPELHHIGWRNDTKGTCYTYFKELAEDDQTRLEDFLSLLQSLRCLTITSHLAPHFQRELDEAYSLDFNFQQETFPLAYTETGDMEHRAKEEHNPVAIKELIQRLATVIQRHPTMARADIIVGLPPRPSKTFHLPVELVKGIGSTLNRPVGLRLAKDEHPKLRDLPLVGQKIATLTGVFTLDESVRGKTVLIIDDLYQSGATAWSLAKFLKKHGAREVYALACVKSWSDTDNV